MGNSEDVMQAGRSEQSTGDLVHEAIDPRIQAATMIQRQFRGYLARKSYKDKISKATRARFSTPRDAHEGPDEETPSLDPDLQFPVTLITEWSVIWPSFQSIERMYERIQ